MELYIDRQELIQGLARVQGIVERRTTNPALAHVLLSADGDHLRLTATDTMLALVADYKAGVEKAGELSVDAQSFFQIARSLPEPTVHLQAVSGNRLQIRCGNSEFHVVGMSAEDFVPLPSHSDERSISIDNGDLRRMIEETRFAVSADDNRWGLNGAHIEEVTSTDGQARVRMVGTDGSRLAWSEASYEGDFEMDRRMLLPRKALGEVRKLTEAVTERWDVAFGARSATFSTTGITLIARLVDGEFPDYRQVLPAEFKRTATMEHKALHDALRRVSIVASDRNHSVRFAFESDIVVLTAENVDLGDAREELAVEMDGDSLYTGFNGRFFQDILSSVKDGRIQLRMGDALDPCIIRFEGRDDCLFVIMPMRLD